jgi:hypothetical protein
MDLSKNKIPTTWRQAWFGLRQVPMSRGSQLYKLRASTIIPTPCPFRTSHLPLGHLIQTARQCHTCNIQTTITLATLIPTHPPLFFQRLGIPSHSMLILRHAGPPPQHRPWLSRSWPTSPLVVARYLSPPRPSYPAVIGPIAPLVTMSFDICAIKFGSWNSSMNQLDYGSASLKMSLLIPHQDLCTLLHHR